MRGMGHADPMETALVTHQEGNEGEKNGVKRGNGGFYGGKLLKRKEETVAVRVAVREENVALSWPGLLSQQGAARTAVRIVTVDTFSF